MILENKVLSILVLSGSNHRIAKIRFLQKCYMHKHQQNNTVPDPFDNFQKTIDQFHEYYRAAVSNLQKWWSTVYDFCVCKAEKHRHINKNEIFDAKKARGLYYGGDIYEFFVEDDDKGRHHTKHAFSGVPVVVI